MEVRMISHRRTGWLRRRTPIFLGLLMVITTYSLVKPTLGGSEAYSAMPGDIGLSLEVLPREGTITAGEPLLARIKVTNLSGEDLDFCPTAGGASTTYLEVRDDKDQVVAATPRPRLREGGLRFPRHLSPGKCLTWVWVLTALYEFEKPGLYTVCAQQLELEEGLPVIAEAAESVRVLPFDASRLEARCEEIFGPLRKRSWPRTDLPMDVRLKALYSVRNEVVLPYLEWLAREEGAKYACRAMLRMGTEKAKNIVNALAVRQDSGGEAARAAMKMALQPRNLLWDMGIGGTPVPDRE